MLDSKLFLLFLFFSQLSQSLTSDLHQGYIGQYSRRCILAHRQLGYCPHPRHGVKISVLFWYSSKNKLSELVTQPMYRLSTSYMLKYTKKLTCHHIKCEVLNVAIFLWDWVYYLFLMKNHISLVVICNEKGTINHWAQYVFKAKWKSFFMVFFR